MKTNIEIDDELLEAARRVTGLQSAKSSPPLFAIWCN
jgi:Arc/MetJ family transcription regulator